MSDRSFKIEKNRINSIKLLKIVVDALNVNGIRYYLDFGTLIGAVRENSLILWDDDIDISLLDEDDYSKIPNILKEINKKYKLRTYLFTFEQSIVKFNKKNKIKQDIHLNFTNNANFQIAKVRDNKFFIFGRGNSCIDIFFKYKFENKSYWLAYGKTNSVPLEYMSDQLVEIDFCGLKCTILKEYDSYLTYKYGDWKIPKETWNHNDDDFSIDNDNQR
jgi:phosphorylcholine metabolism protein LicD